MNWSNNYTKQNNQKNSKGKLKKYVSDLETEYIRLKNQYEPTNEKLELRGQKLIDKLVDSHKG